MNLQGLLSRHPSVALATPRDNEAILDFFHQLPMKGEGLILKYDRSPDFFEFLRLQSPSFFVFLLRDRGAIEGVGTLVIREGYVDGKRCPVGYLGDLRVKPGIRNAVNWRKFYQDIIENCDTVDEFLGVRYFLTAVIDSNQAAQKALVSNKRQSYVYHALCPYEMVNVFARKPWKRPPTVYSVRSARSEDLERLQSFWIACERKKQFGQPELLNRALQTWEDFSVDSILIAQRGDEIVGMTALWSPRRAKKIILMALPKGLRAAARVLRLVKPFPREGEELSPLYLSLLNFVSPEVLAALIHHVFRKDLLRGHHLLGLCSFPHLGTETALPDFLYEKVPMALYQVYAAGRPELELEAQEVGFEMALV